ncbi:hypothetical protein [Oleiharenicola lentus]|nr:hypothetical protein [Oleiharenicola lentus]
MLVLSGLLLPGAGWAFGARLPLPWLAAGIISALVLLAGVIGLSAAHVPISLVSLSLWLAGVGLAGGWYWRSRPGISAPASRTNWQDCWLALPVLPMLIVACWRALTQPLSGVDVDFRWNHLALQLVAQQGLDFYPPVSPPDFTRYFWADGISPLVAGLYAWTYLAAGSTAKVWTAIPVVAQMLGLVFLVQALSRLWSSDHRSGWIGVALAGCCMLLQFAFNLGQETGLTALGVGGLMYYLTRWQRGEGEGLLLLAALCGGLVACAREYGPLYPGVSALWLLWRGSGWRTCGRFVAAALLLPGLWHLRVWIITGNPLYAHDLGSLFPGNPVFSAWMQAYMEAYGGVLAQAVGWRELGRLIVVSALPATAGVAAGIVVMRKRPEAGLGLLLVAAGLCTWIISIPYTAGGLFYSMRVLSPVLLLGCAWGGAVLATLVVRKGLRVACGLVLVVWSLDASLRALTIPLNPYRTPVRAWPDAGGTYQVEFAREAAAFVAAAIPHIEGRVLSDSAGLQHLFQEGDRDFVPLWSPDVRFLFANEADSDAGGRLRRLGYSHLLLKRAQSSIDFLERTGAWKKLQGQLTPVMANETYILLALRAPPAAP